MFCGQVVLARRMAIRSFSIVDETSSGPVEALNRCCVLRRISSARHIPSKMFTRFFLIAVAGLMFSQPVFALPAFARRYGTSCTTCHAIIPKLNPFGIAFRNNGYRIPVNDEKFVKTPDVSLGAPEWKKVWPKAVWPGAIPAAAPISFRAVADAEMKSPQPRLNFDFPKFLALYFAGAAGDSISYFGQVALDGTSGSVQIDRAYAQFKLTPERPGFNWAMLKVGRIDGRAEPFSSTYRRTTSESFNVSDYLVFKDGFRLRGREPGIELWGAATGPDDRGGLEYAVGVVQAAGPGAEYATALSVGEPESYNFKDYYWSASYKFFGNGVVGSRHEKESLDTMHNYAEKSLQLGTFGYRGKRDPEIAGFDEDEFTRSGLKLDLYYQNLNLYGAVVLGKDTLEAPVPRIVKSSAFFVEADYMALPWVMPLIRFEKTNYSDGRRSVVAAVPAVNLAIRANVRLEIEGRFFNRAFTARDTRSGINQAVFRLDFLF